VPEEESGQGAGAQGAGADGAEVGGGDSAGEGERHPGRAHPLVCPTNSLRCALMYCTVLCCSYCTCVSGAKGQTEGLSLFGVHSSILKSFNVDFD